MSHSLCLTIKTRAMYHIEIKGTTKKKMERQHCKEEGNHLEQESNKQRTMEGTDGGKRPEMDGQSLGEV